MFPSRSQDKQICRLQYLQTRTPGRERPSVRADDLNMLNDLSSSWEEVCLLYSIKIIIKAISTRLSSFSTRTNGYFSLWDDLAKDENIQTPFFPRVFFTKETGASSPQFLTQHAPQLPVEISRSL